MLNIYHPIKVKISQIKTLSKDVKLFRLKKDKGDFPRTVDGLCFTPGQFVLLGLFGYGEAPFGPASAPDNFSYVDVVVRRVGNLTSAIHRLKKGDRLFLRGPYGNGFPLKFFEDKDVILVTGGCGLPPIASLIEYIVKNRKKFGRVYLVYGARTPADLLMKDRIKEWQQKKIKVLLTVDQPTKDWSGYVGMVTDLIDEIEISPKNAAAAMCGPGPMMDALEKILRPLGIADRRIFVSLERKMQCGVGKCQHCTTGDKYVCLDGPVFYYDQIEESNQQEK